MESLYYTCFCKKQPKYGKKFKLGDKYYYEIATVDSKKIIRVFTESAHPLTNRDYEVYSISDFNEFFETETLPVLQV